jgi:uncharacterized MAPEG superfamily protein
LYKTLVIVSRPERCRRLDIDSGYLAILKVRIAAAEDAQVASANTVEALGYFMVAVNFANAIRENSQASKADAQIFIRISAVLRREGFGGSELGIHKKE